MFGPEYHKINSVFKRDERGVIIPWDWTCPEFDYLSAMPWRFTEKVDGTNIRIHWDGKDALIGGRTDNAQVPTFLLVAIARLLQGARPFEHQFPGMNDVTLYGEGYGAKIQKGGGNYRADQGFILFDVRVGDWWLTDDSVAEIAGEMGIDIVPTCLDGWTLEQACYAARDGGLVSAWPGVQIEGLVGRPKADLFNRKGERIITKVKVRDWTDYARRTS